MYPVKDAGSEPLMQWIKEYTSPTAVFLAPPDIFDPVTLAGRKNFWGFYKNFGTPDRSLFVKNIFEAKEPTILLEAKEEGIEYLVLPKFKKADFHYTTDEYSFRTFLPVVYEDNTFVIYTLIGNTE